MGADMICALTLPDLVTQAARRWPERELLVFDQQRLTFREAERQSALLARQLLAAGIGKGAHVGLLFPNAPAFVVSLLAVGRIGAVAVPVSTFSTAAELRTLVRHADLKAILFADQFLGHDYINRLEEAFPTLSDQLERGAPLSVSDAPFLRRAWVWSDQPPSWAQSALSDFALAPSAVLKAAEAQVVSADIGAIIYTSGSTGEPKGVVHSQGNLLRQSVKQAEDGDYRAGDRIFSAMPLFWVGGLTYKLLPAMQVGACLLGTANGAADALLDFIERERTTLFLGWPYHARALMAAASFADRDLSALRGGNLYAALPVECRPSDPGLVISGLGMTETAGPHTAGQRRLVDESLRGSVGWAAPGMEHRVVDAQSGRDLEDGELGELWVRGDTLMLGLYKRDPTEVFTADGWYRTRDLVSRRDGHFFFEGRLDDMVKIRGVNIAPREVESCLLTLDGVVHVAVTGVRDASGDLVLAAAVLTVDPALDENTVRQFLRAELSAYKVPTLICLLPAAELPMRSSGKVDRLALVDRLQAAVGADTPC